MPDKDAATPRVFLLRHGETEWTQNGRHTGTTELPLTTHGEAQVSSSGRIFIGPGKLIDPVRIAHVYISPRSRAKRTFELAFDDTIRSHLSAQSKVSECPAIAEWDYGDYEGLLTKEIKEGRKSRGLDKEREWDVWLDGCEGGESPEQATARLDHIISEIRKFHIGNMQSERPGDVVLLTHGKISRAFIKRWVGLSLSDPNEMLFEPGAIGALSYYHQDINRPAMVFGLSV